MSKILIFLVGCLVHAAVIFAQQPATNNNWFSQFQSFNTAQVLNGSSGTSFSIQSVNGFSFDKLFVGLGTGVDFYYQTSIPLFVEARYPLVEKKNTLQVFANGGVNFALATQNDKFLLNVGEYKPGSLYGVGVDYLVPTGKASFILGLAFTNKHMVYLQENNTWNPALNRVENVPIKNSYSFNRFAFRLGWLF